jgi:hypothetical protein
MATGWVPALIALPTWLFAVLIGTRLFPTTK